VILQQSIIDPSLNTYIVQYNIIVYSTLQYITVKCSTIQNLTVQNITALSRIILYDT